MGVSRCRHPAWRSASTQDWLNDNQSPASPRDDGEKKAQGREAKQIGNPQGFYYCFR
jgi:hypothetical protein